MDKEIYARLDSLSFDKKALRAFSEQELKEYIALNKIPGIEECEDIKDLAKLIAKWRKKKSLTNEPIEVEEPEPIKILEEPQNKLTFRDIAGLKEAKAAFSEKVILPLEHPELYSKFQKRIGGGILLFGPPGTGKTTFAKAAAGEAKAAYLPLTGSDIKKGGYGGSEKIIHEVFTKAKATSKAIIFFDEFDSVATSREERPENDSIINQLLIEMEDLKEVKVPIMVLASTNRPWSLDSALLRPGRFDEKIYIPLPDLEARAYLYALKFKDIPTEELDFNLLASKSEGYNGADIAGVSEKIKMLAIKESMAKKQEVKINMTMALEVLATYKSSVDLKEIERFKNFLNS